MSTRGTEEIKGGNDELMRFMTGLQHTPAVRRMCSATNDHVAKELDSRGCFGQEVCKIVCSWHVDNIDLS